jgi:hypothetical protein
MVWWSSLRAIHQFCGLREKLPLGNPWEKAVAFKGHRFAWVNLAKRQTDTGQNVALYYCGCKQMAVKVRRQSGVYRDRRRRLGAWTFSV